MTSKTFGLRWRELARVRPGATCGMLARNTLMTTFRARFRFRVHTKLNLDCAEHQLKVDGRDVVLSTPHPQTLIKDSEWLHMNARGFASEDEAQLFANQLKAAAEVFRLRRESASTPAQIS